MLLASLYLAQRRMSEYSSIMLLVNVLAVGLGVSLTLKFDAMAMFGSIAFLNCLAVGYLASRILNDPPSLRSVRAET
jgi:hypothetical protein